MLYSDTSYAAEEKCNQNGTVSKKISGWIIYLTIDLILFLVLLALILAVARACRRRHRPRPIPPPRWKRSCNDDGASHEDLGDYLNPSEGICVVSEIGLEMDGSMRTMYPSSMTGSTLMLCTNPRKRSTLYPITGTRSLHTLYPMQPHNNCNVSIRNQEVA